MSRLGYFGAAEDAPPPLPPLPPAPPSPAEAYIRAQVRMKEIRDRLGQTRRPSPGYEDGDLGPLSSPSSVNAPSSPLPPPPMLPSPAQAPPVVVTAPSPRGGALGDLLKLVGVGVIAGLVVWVMITGRARRN